MFSLSLYFPLAHHPTKPTLASDNKKLNQGGNVLTCRERENMPLFVFWISDPKQNERLLLRPVSKTTFMPYHIFFLFKVLQQSIKILSGYWSYHGEQIASYRIKEHKNLFWKLVSKMTSHFVWGHPSRKQIVMHDLSLKLISYRQIEINIK